MRFLAILIALLQLAAGQQLHVRSATARAVRLEWTGATGPVAVERADGTTFKEIAASDQPDYEDTTISPFATYRYRVSSGGKSSNEVIVGPPPGGVLNVAPVPKGTEPVKYGQAAAIALDENGDPVIAFEWVDPNGDNDYADNDVRFVRWSRASHQWLAPVRVQVVGEISTQNLNPISIGCDRKTGVLAIITPIAEKGASILISKDSGATWSGSPVPGTSGTVTSTSAVIADGIIHLVLNSPETGARYLTGSIDNLASLKSDALPASEGWKQQTNVNVGLAMSSGKPVVAWYETQDEGEGRRFQIWRPNSSVSTAVETKRSTDLPSLAIAGAAGKIGLLIHTPLDEKDENDRGIWYVQSNDGATWSKPAKLPIDGPRSTNPPQDVAIDSRGRVVAVFSSNSGSGTTGCNYPVLSRSNDGVTWTTCGPGKAEGGDFGPQPATLHAIAADNDKAYVLWQEPGENKFQEGMLLWHER